MIILIDRFQYLASGRHHRLNIDTGMKPQVINRFVIQRIDHRDHQFVLFDLQRNGQMPFGQVLGDHLKKLGTDLKRRGIDK